MNLIMAMNMGGDDFIPKPFDWNVLLAKIQALLRRTYDFGGQVSLLEHRDAILNIAVYPGHAEGDAEGKMIQEYLASVSRHRICATMVKILNSPTSPYFIVVETKPAK